VGYAVYISAFHRDTELNPVRDPEAVPKPVGIFGGLLIIWRGTHFGPSFLPGRATTVCCTSALSNKLLRGTSQIGSSFAEVLL
jgi:hypothetical protein